ncbi:carbonic anhydrase [Colletotrichum graminicola]|uniref:Carbonic anhydrase n=1 Tax=Colletotrichum graminicola (strain M1.001 / M2 / FGSC 10212) TaxID=645133 RepID=E3Q8F9_COLGM|nr:carbonic anhydrase [Colletotrichum graminicola M1.001]EFQ27171.1 carbonic anhydrase [Colletotrichum graminicola M1.001]WDK16199.1 carbonic anhydrase [Colletotrichum graminicola]
MKSSLILPFATLASAICHHRTSLYTRGQGLTARAEGGVDVATFNYNDITGPLNWHTYSNASTTCSTGVQQSPINLNDTSATLVSGKTLGFDVPDLPHGAEFENLGSTLEVVAPNGTLTRRGRKFNLKQFHFHTPSEHRVDSEYFPMEVHFVFQADEEQLGNSTGPGYSVLGFLIEVDNSAPSEFLKSVFARVDEVAEPGSVSETEPLSFCELRTVLEHAEVYQYDGSLTTPPCSEGIAWNVVAEPLRIDDVTYRAAKKIMKFNARYTQNVPGKMNLLDYSRTTLNALSA